MPNSSVCLIGPPFSLSGPSVVDGQEITIEVLFDNEEDLDSIIAFEWFLDTILLSSEQAVVFNSSISCGTHNVGVRILSAGGWSGIKSQQVITCNPIVSILINGPDTVTEGDSAAYSVTETYADGSIIDITDEYTFSCPDGTFAGAVFTPTIDEDDEDKPSVITAQKGSEEPLTKAITILAYHVVIEGPDTVTEGAPAAGYGVFINGTFTTLYTLSCPDGSFVTDGVFTAFVDSATVARPSVVSAKRNGYPVVNKNITIEPLVQPALPDNPGVLVVDIYGNTTLNIIAYVENPEVSNNNVPAFTGDNFVPDGASAADAMILASDVILDNNLSWRFEFNFSQLINNYPETPEFILDIAGRGAEAGTFNAAFGAKTFATTMVMSNSPGNYIPGISGSNLVNPVYIYNVPLSDGADGSYAIEDLPLMIRFCYVVATKVLSYITVIPNAP